MATLFVMLGLYGVVAYSVSRRTSDIGIRMALGAQSTRILHTVVAQGLRLATLAVAGIARSLLVSRILSSFLFQVKPNDPLVFVGASVLVVVVTLVASYFPAHKSSSVDPTIALRHRWATAYSDDRKINLSVFART